MKNRNNWTVAAALTVVATLGLTACGSDGGSGGGNGRGGGNQGGSGKAATESGNGTSSRAAGKPGGDSAAKAGKERTPRTGEELVNMGAQKCPWPSVCFYRGGKIVAAYKDMGPQSVGPKARTATSVYNSRKDDAANLVVTYRGGKTAYAKCAKPRGWYKVHRDWPVTTIDISPSPRCL
ncbi:hypothetical protein [Streptomyces iconiensis]|uniref:Peptidase inhibitor family I36 n=1 Tax=Streptomyces iconiensis TaxID=1384038 RepID=A0ABT7A7J0_9ACTN|nr:hypothetical protein [Streptomyces iconiensis]MDJ1137312.1 hypothetical protein [Streptomyces iconiensis]